MSNDNPTEERKRGDIKGVVLRENFLLEEDFHKAALKLKSEFVYNIKNSGVRIVE